MDEGGGSLLPEADTAMHENGARALLGRLLVASGTITEEDLAEALRLQSGRDQRLGEVLVAMGALAPRQLERALRAQGRLRGGAQSGGCLILVVDDDPEIGALLGQALTGAGYRVGVASDTEEALAALSVLDAGKPSLVVLDLALPGRDGLELLAALKENATTRRVPAIVLSGQSDALARLESCRLHAERVLRKPVLARYLLTEVEAVLGESSGSVPLGTR